MTPYDDFCNPGASGGRFTAELVQDGYESASPIPCRVTESTTGALLSIAEVAYPRFFFHA